MPQPIHHATYRLYETYHLPVNVQRDRSTYDHFASAYSRSLRQEELLTSYLTAMTDAIREDIRHNGDCWLLRAIVTGEVPTIHLLDHSAIACVYAALFTLEEAPVPDGRIIPFSGAFSASAGGMRYADRRARTCVIDLRTDAMLHPLCHALRATASMHTLQAENAALREEALRQNSRITALMDQILGLERSLAALQPADKADANAESTAGPDASDA
ncbi:MAG: hypothetical protein IKK57_05000 [Clostridia bacterium]|nr:hypothetical protein [Clostridia bacterium]